MNLTSVRQLLRLLKAWFALGPAPADPKGLDYAPCEPLVNGRLVTIEVIRVNDQEAVGRSLEEAIEGFSKYVAGEVRTVEGERVELDADKDGLLTTSQLKSIIAERRHYGPSDVCILLVPALSDLGSGARCMPQPHGSHVVVIQGNLMTDPAPVFGAEGGIVKRLLVGMAKTLLTIAVPLETRWHLVIKHELLHALQLPYDRSHVSAYHHHCTHPECLLYGCMMARSVLRGILGLGPPLDLCRVCQREIRWVQEAAGGRLIGPEEPYDHMRWLNALVRLNPDSSRAYGYRAQAHQDRGNYDKAIVDLTKAVELDPGNPVEYMYRAQVYAKNESYEEAIEDLTKALDLDATTRTATCYRNRGVLLARVGELKPAISDWERYLQLKPDDTQALNTLAWMLATCPDGGIRDGPRAIKLARRTCELTKWEAPWALDTLAAACAEVGQFDEAIEYQGKAASLADEEDAKDFRQRLKLYCAGNPFRDSGCGVDCG